jgi:hypothetical protein
MSVMRQRPLFASHILIVLSLLPEAKYSRVNSSIGFSLAPPFSYEGCWASSSFFFSRSAFLLYSRFFIAYTRSAVVIYERGLSATFYSSNSAAYNYN